jgi:hypothetical protein
MRLSIRNLVFVIMFCSLTACARAEQVSSVRVVSTTSKPISTTPIVLMPTTSLKRIPTYTKPIHPRHPASDSQGCPKFLTSYPHATKISEQTISNWERIASYEFRGQPDSVFDYYDQQLPEVGWVIMPRKADNPGMANDASYRYSFDSAILVLDINVTSKKTISINTLSA